MKRRVWIAIGVGVVALGAVIAIPLGFVLCIRWQLAHAEAAVSDPAVCDVVAPSLARLCQSDPFFFHDEPPCAPAWTPQEILNLHPTWVEIEPNGARVEFGGGFHHFGYVLGRDTAADTSTANGWKLELYSEDSSNRLLKAFTLDKSKHLELPVFINQALAEFRRRALAGGDERAVQERLTFLLKFDEVDRARTSIRESAAASVHDWPDQLLAFVIDHQVDPSASKRLDDWAAAKGDSSAWLLAAYAYGLVEDGDALARSTKRALTTPLNEPAWLNCNTQFRGMVVGLQLLELRKYETCSALCDALLVQSPGGHLKLELSSLRDLAKRTHAGDPAPPPPSIDEGKLFTPFKGIDLARLIVVPGTAATAATLPVDPRARMIHYLDRQIAADPQSWRNWDAKFKYLRSIKREQDVRQAYQAAAQALPDWWKPRLALAMFGDLDSRMQERAVFEAWVHAHPAFVRWCYLSRLLREAGQDSAALDALREAVKYPLESVDEDEYWVPQAFAFDAATFACRHREYDLVLAITDVWSKPRGVYDYFDDNVYAFRAAAELGKGQFVAAQADAAKVVDIAKSRALWAQNLQALQRAAAGKDTSFAYEPDPNHEFADFAPFRD